MMLATRTSASLIAISMSCVALLLFCKSGLPQEGKTNPRIQDLQQKRLAVLKRVCDSAEANNAIMRGSFGEVLAAKAALLAARIEYAETRQDRIKACEDAVKSARDLQDIARERARAPAPLGSLTEALIADALVLEMQIRFETARAD